MKTLKQELIELITTKPFKEISPIGRKKFIIGLILISLLVFINNILIYKYLFNNSLWGLIISIIFSSYLIATWSTKRLFDINSKINTQKVQILFFILYLISYIFAYLVQSNIEIELNNLFYNNEGSEIFELSENTNFNNFFLKNSKFILIINYVTSFIIAIFNCYFIFKKGKIEERKKNINNCEDNNIKCEKTEVSISSDNNKQAHVSIYWIIFIIVFIIFSILSINSLIL